MPSTITHAFMAKDIYNKLEKNLKKKFEDKFDLYMTYSEGPDVLFFYPVIPSLIKSIKVRKFAKRVHRENVNKLFISLINSVKEDKNFDKFIFVSGLLTHYVADRTCHPYVNYQAWNLEKITGKKKDYHFLIEAYIDNYILNLRGENYKKYKCYKLIKTTKNEAIKEMLNKSFLEVFNKENMGNIYYTSLFNMKILYFLIRYDPYKIKRLCYLLIHWLLPFLYRQVHYFSYNFKLSNEKDITYLNLNKEEWFNIKSREIKYNKSFLDLYEETVNQSKEMIEKLYDYIYNDKKLDLESFIGNRSYANGLPLKK